MHEETVAPAVMPQAANSGLFPATMWSMIQAANSETAALAGLERLARAYWRPLYVFARQRGAEHEAAMDQAQGFFEHLISQEMLADVQRGEVRFRSFLLRCFTNWLANQQRDANRQKRGGGQPVASLEQISEVEGNAVLVDGLSPDLAYDRRWARALVDQVMRRLDAEHAERERGAFLSEVRRRVFASDGAVPDWEEMAALHGMSHGAVRKAAADMRRRFGVLLREEVRQVVATDAEVDDELRYLLSLISAA
ncbi:RNA polymerase sigma factor [Prosthecobacter sp.]|jgi:DNA-directed RNA polymerase specialized sigma24 family protein|uniref:RNA polymerase sigma factor n=1 Tax=Prosthecobacter sp. TaxID=1965333 RepID=UPI003782ECAC